VAGAEYRGAAAVLSWLLVAASLDLGASVLRAASYAMGQAGAVLRLNLIALAAYAATFLPLTQLMGLTGPGAAACVSSALMMGGMVSLVARGRPPVALAAGS
jgi:O-antigen/teichoic acid export membrane protein